MAKRHNGSTVEPTTPESESQMTQTPAVDEFTELFGENGTSTGNNVSALQEQVRQLQLQLEAQKRLVAAVKGEPRGPGGYPRATLETIIQRQAKNPATWAILGVANYVEQRTKLGQPQEQAMEQVISAIREVAESVLAEPHPQGLMKSVSAYVKTHFPESYVAKSATAKSKGAAGGAEDANEASAFEVALDND